MNFIHSDLGTVREGTVVVAHLAGTEANVRLLDDFNFARYRRGESHQYYGGHYERSPVHIRVPSTGRWNVAVDLGGYAGRVEASISVIEQ